MNRNQCIDRIYSISNAPFHSNVDLINNKKDLDELVLFLTDVCECKDKQKYLMQKEHFISTISSLKQKLENVKTENLRLAKENGIIKNMLQEIKTRLLELSNGKASSSDPERLRSLAKNGSEEAEQWFPTQQWVSDLSEDMNPSTDADNFEKTNSNKDATSDIPDNIEKTDSESEYCPLSTYFETDEVFEVVEETNYSANMKNSKSSTAYSHNGTQRIRRTSDVIDSIGISPSHTTKSYSFSYDFSAIKQQEFSISPPRSHSINTLTDSPMTPPMTPSSDLGYSSVGATPPAVGNPRIFHFNSPGVNLPPHRSTQIDAKVMQQEEDSMSFSSSIHNRPMARMPIEKDSRMYNMNHKRRGKAVIFNHEEFRDLPARKGSSHDVKRLQTALTALGFEVDVHHDLEVEKFHNRINMLSSEDHTDADCLLVTVLTHGLNGCLMAKDFAYTPESLWAPFTADKCPSLAGKPKLFLIQACRGDKLDGGVRLINQTNPLTPNHETDTGGAGYKIPTMSDFMVAFSTFEGYYSWRHPEFGTWFIQCLCQVLEEEGQQNSLQEMMTEVSRRVATNYESYNDTCPWQHEQKQVPQINSTLLRQVFFSPKD